MRALVNFMHRDGRRWGRAAFGSTGAVQGAGDSLTVSKGKI